MTQGGIGSEHDLEPRERKHARMRAGHRHRPSFRLTRGILGRCRSLEGEVVDPATGGAVRRAAADPSSSARCAPTARTSLGSARWPAFWTNSLLWLVRMISRSRRARTRISGSAFKFSTSSISINASHNPLSSPAKREPTFTGPQSSRALRAVRDRWERETVHIRGRRTGVGGAGPGSETESDRVGRGSGHPPR